MTTLTILAPLTLFTVLYLSHQLENLQRNAAEDNIVNQKVATKMLEKMGQVVDIVPNGREAVVASGRTAYDVILMDLQMPVMDGIEAARRILETQARHSPPYIIGFTANAMKSDRNKCLQTGMKGFVAKPVNRNELMEALMAASGVDIPEPEPVGDPF